MKDVKAFILGLETQDRLLNQTHFIIKTSLKAK
jgi:hypothetical protein